MPQHVAPASLHVLGIRNLWQRQHVHCCQNQAVKAWIIAEVMLLAVILSKKLSS